MLSTMAGSELNKVTPPETSGECSAGGDPWNSHRDDPWAVYRGQGKGKCIEKGDHITAGSQGMDVFDPPPLVQTVDKIVEKVVDFPQLQVEKIVEIEKFVEVPVVQVVEIEKIVEKIVEVPTAVAQQSLVRLEKLLNDVEVQTDTTPHYLHIEAEIDEAQVIINNANNHEGSVLGRVKRSFQIIGIDPQARHVDMKIVGTG